MPALYVTQPGYATWLDLHDADSPVDRQIASAAAAVQLAAAAVLNLKYDPTTGVSRGSGKFLRPLHITSDKVSAYETNVTACETALKGATGLLATLRAMATA